MVHGWMMRRLASVAATLGALLFVADASAGDQPDSAAAPAETTPVREEPKAVRLRYKFQPGQVVRYEVTDETKITALADEVTETQHTRTDTRRSYRVSGVNDEGSGDLELAIDWVRMSVSFGNGGRQGDPIEFQSDDPTKQPEKFRHILGTVGKPRALLRVTPRGSVIQGAAPGALPPGNDASPESCLITLPADPRVPGDEWKERFEITVVDDKLPVRIAMQRKYTLQSVKDDLATIEFRTAILTPIHDPKIATQLIQREVAGTIVFDIEQGLLVSREVAVDQTVPGFAGAKTSMRAVSTYRERLLTEKPTEVSSAVASPASSPR